MAYISPVLTAMANAVKKATIALTRDFNELEHLQSGRNDGRFAAHSYEKVEKILKEELAKIKPSFAFVSQKNDAIPANGNCFLLAPIDGFACFAHGNGSFAVSAALMENGIVTHAVIYSPVYDELFFAEKGCGAFKEGFRSHERLRVSGNKNSEQALIGCSANADLFKKALNLSTTVLVKGSSALDLAYLAAGKLDIAVSSDNLPQTIAAGMLLVKEAGGYIVALGETDVRSEDFNQVLFGGALIATNEALRQKAADILAK
ncbi:MAG: inositol monophosphatase family protein [Pseudomonadota bacterium]|nr:inositol monophosphatase family protein [Pseudomonadota bacterium]